VDSPQSWNRFSYVNNNPLNYNDPTGHVCSDPENTNNNSGCESGNKFVTKKEKKLSRELFQLRHTKGSLCSDPVPPIVCKPDITSLPSIDDIPTPLPQPNVPDLQEFEDWAWFTENTLKVIDYASSYEDIINTTKPVYKQVKYAFGTGGLEAIIDGIMYGVKDRWSTSLTPGQRAERIVAAAAQSFVVDQTSQLIGKGGMLVGGLAGQVGAQYLSSGLLTEYLVPWTTLWYFEARKLGVPQNISPLK
jgi:hypothetical protein